jgi:hypothetical protein
VTGVSRPTDLSQNVNATKSTRARFILQDICALCGLGELTCADALSAGAHNTNPELNRTRETVYVRQHTYKKTKGQTVRF